MYLTIEGLHNTYMLHARLGFGTKSSTFELQRAVSIGVDRHLCFRMTLEEFSLLKNPARGRHGRFLPDEDRARRVFP